MIYSILGDMTKYFSMCIKIKIVTIFPVFLLDLQTEIFRCITGKFGSGARNPLQRIILKIAACTVVPNGFLFRTGEFTILFRSALTIGARTGDVISKQIFFHTDPSFINYSNTFYG